MPLLTWTSFPVILLAVWVIVEALPFAFRGLRPSRGWTVTAWSLRPGALWAAYNIVFRYFAELGLNERSTFPFAFEQWHARDGWSTCFTRFIHSEAFWFWSAVVLLLGILFAGVCHWILSSPLTRTRVALALGALILLNIAMPLAYDCLPEGAEDPLENKGSFLSAWFHSGFTMLYCMPHIKSKGDYLRHFEEIQPRLQASIHGVSHPPGASLALYWLGKPFGATQRIGRDRLRYALATTTFASLALLSIFLLGYSVTGSTRTGLMAAALWAVKPAALAYNTFAADPVYTVFNILCLAFIWRVVTSPRRPWGALLALGLTLYVQSMLNFNWILFAGLFGIFLTLQAVIHRWRLQEWFLRTAIPAALVFGLLIWTCVSYHLDYWAIYQYALSYTHRFYHMETAYKWLMSLIGSPIDLFLLSGSLTAYLFWRHFPQEASRRVTEPLTLFLLTLLGVYLFTAVSVNILKMESSRVWAWVTALPIVYVARFIADSGSARFTLVMAVIVALLQYYGMKLLLYPCG